MSTCGTSAEGLFHPQTNRGFFNTRAGRVVTGGSVIAVTAVALTVISTMGVAASIAYPIFAAGALLIGGTLLIATSKLPAEATSAPANEMEIPLEGDVLLMFQKSFEHDDAIGSIYGSTDLTGGKIVGFEANLTIYNLNDEGNWVFQTGDNEQRVNDMKVVRSNLMNASTIFVTSSSNETHVFQRTK